MKQASIVMVVGVTLAGCNVERADVDTGGIDLGGAGAGGQPQGGAMAIPPVRGFAVVNSDYQSTSVSLLDPAGEVLSEVFIASSSETTGLSAPLSGDVVPPTMPATGQELVLIDRSAASVLTWIDLETAEVRAQLSAATGFSANPHDYVAVSDSKAYVTRFDPNLDQGREPFDQGDDVLIVDPAAARIAGRIDLGPAFEGEASAFFARPDRALMAGGLLRVSAIGYDADFLDAADSRIVTIDPESDEITHVLVLDGLRSCVNLAPSPDGTQLAVACSGTFDQDPVEGYPDSGIVILEVGSELVERQRFGASELGGAQSNALSYASPTSIAFTTFGRWNDDRSAPAAPDALRLLDLDTGDVDPEPLLESRDSPFVIVDVRCDVATAACMVTDTETGGGVVHRFDVDADGGLGNRTSIDVDRTFGLPPRYLGAF